jgi:hypothetical protein
MAKAKRAGAGARCSVLLSKLHPADYVAQHFRNTSVQDRLYGLIATKQEEMTWKGKIVQFTFFTHPDHPGIEFSSGYLVITDEGPEDQIFVNAAPAAAAAAADKLHQDAPEPIDASVFAAGNNAEDIALVLGQGLDVDDDNEPAPENFSQAGGPAKTDTGLYPGQSWGWDGLDPRQTSNIQHCQPSFNNDWNPIQGLSPISRCSRSSSLGIGSRLCALPRPTRHLQRRNSTPSQHWGSSFGSLAFFF